MGEVYRALDTRLGREVAVKVAHERFSDRFEREARAVAALNHPNICTLYDVGPNYLVMELIEGESPKGPMPVDEALRVAAQMAAALDAAHSKGIVHRDLKPANLKIKSDGTVKVLDFGLAKSQDAPAGDPENSPTLTISMTRAGMIVGTAAYMAPEQARGKTVDKRADIWAFGVVLYELLTGKRPFSGESMADCLAAIVKDEPELNAVPAKVRRVLAACLEKDRDKRLRDIGDVWRLLEEPAVAVQPVRGWRWAAAGLVCLLIGIAGWLRPGPATENFEAAFSFRPGPGTEFEAVGGSVSEPEISPDGSTILYSANGLYLRRLDSEVARRLPGAAQNTAFWSGDSTTVFFPAAQSRLLRIRLPDGAPDTVAELPGPTRGGSISENGTILTSVMGQLMFRSPIGGEFRNVELPDELKSGGFNSPQFLPRSEDFLCLFGAASRDPDNHAVYLATLHDGKAVQPVKLMTSQTAALYTPAGGGRLLFVRNGNLYSQHLNWQGRHLDGPAELLVSGVAYQPGKTIHRAEFSVALNGTIAWRSGGATVAQLTEFDRNGAEKGRSGPPDSFASVIVSPDETRLLFFSQESGWLAETGRPGKLALPNGVLWYGWLDGGKKLIGWRLGMLVEMDGNGSGELHESGPFTDQLRGPPTISADGRVGVGKVQGGLVSFRLDSMSPGMSPAIVVPRGTAASPALSPDGRWLAYFESGSGGGLYVQPFPGPGPRRQIAPEMAGNNYVVWRGDGREILFRARETLMSVPVEWDGEPKFGSPRKLFSGLVFPAGGNVSDRPLAVSRDGSRIFWAQGIEQPDSHVIHVKVGAVR
jgi:serine/threonine protein kinase